MLAGGLGHAQLSQISLNILRFPSPIDLALPASLAVHVICMLTFKLLTFILLQKSLDESKNQYEQKAREQILLLIGNKTEIHGLRFMLQIRLNLGTNKKPRKKRVL